MYDTETGESWSDYLKDFGSDGGPLLGNLDDMDTTDSTTSSFFFGNAAGNESSTDFMLGALPMKLDQTTLGMARNNDLPATISPITLTGQQQTNTPIIATNFKDNASSMTTNSSKNIINRYPMNSLASGMSQFMPKINGDLTTIFGSPATSQDSPLTGSLSNVSSTNGEQQSRSAPRRDAHMASEQRRRAIMKDSFERLQRLLPPSEYRKPSKANLLQAAVSYITYLKQTEGTLRGKVQWLVREKTILTRQISGGPLNFSNANDILTDDKNDSATVANLPIAPAIPRQNPHT